MIITHCAGKFQVLWPINDSGSKRLRLITESKRMDVVSRGLPRGAGRFPPIVIIAKNSEKMLALIRGNT